MHFQADQQEDDRVEREGHVFPKRLHGDPGRGRHADPGPIVSAEHARRYGGNHAGVMEMLGRQERSVGGNRGQRDLNHRIIHLADDLRNGQADSHPNEGAQADDLDEIEGQPTGRHHRPGHEGHAEREENNRGAVVEQALPFEQYRQTLRDTQALEKRDYGDGVGGRDDRAKNQRVFPGKALHKMQGVGDRRQNQGRQRDGRHHPGQGQRMNGEAVTPELFELDIKRGLEEQPRQEDVEQQRLGQVRRFEGMAAAPTEGR